MAAEMVMIPAEWQANAPVEVIERVVVAGGEPHTHKAWPAAELAANGDLLVAYKDGADHNITDSAVVMLARSRDNGRTWTHQRILEPAPDHSQCFITNHGMTRLHDGTLLLTVHRQWHQEYGGKREIFDHPTFIRSTDNGKSWEPPLPDVRVPYLSDIGETYSYGRGYEFDDGRVMVPFEGVPVNATNARLRATGVGFSRDRGKTWHEFSLIHADYVGDICPNETDVLKLRDGRYLAMIRSNPTLRLYKSFSSDGETWTPIEQTVLPGNCPALLLLNSGAVLCGYRNRIEGAEGLGFGVSYDNGGTWTHLGNLYNGSNVDCAYPSMVRLPNGDIFCAYYTAAEPAWRGWCEIHGLLLQDLT